MTFISIYSGRFIGETLAGATNFVLPHIKFELDSHTGDAVVIAPVSEQIPC